MKINQTKLVEVDARTLKITAKCSDMFSFEICDQNNKVIFNQEDGYVPEFMPGENYGDYIMLDIDIDTGVITNWVKPTQEQIEEFINQYNDN
mgnify:CR=1 FL=1|tara:strand:- start:7738 stop:8013 length:276 start_codon:yes stop_codon:yes gene_type:complete